MKERYSKDRIILIFIFGIIQLLFLISIGIYAKEEATKYSDEATYFVQHLRFSQPKYFFYSGYIALHLLSHFVGAGKVGVYMIQLLMNGLAMSCFYSLALQLSSRQSVAFISTLLLIFCWPFQMWTVYLFTESFFFSLIILYLYALFNNRWAAGKKTVAAAILFFLILISRPTGLLMIVPTVALVSTHLLNKKKFVATILFWSAGLVAFIFITNAAMSGQGEFDFLKPYVEEHVICGYAQNNIGLEQPTGGNSLGAVADYIIHHFGQAARLAFGRVAVFFGLIRPYFSTRHNLSLALYFYPIYLFALVGARYVYSSSKTFFTFSAAMIAVFVLSVALTCDDWHNRFIMPLVPIFILFAGDGIYRVVTWVSSWAQPGSRQ